MRAALHQDLVRPGALDPELGKFYDEAFDARQEADYGTAAAFNAEAVESSIATAERFVAEMRRLLARC